MEKMITTTNNFEGYRITGYFGIVSAEVTMPNKRGNVQENNIKFRLDACDSLLERLPEGANAVVGLRGETMLSAIMDSYCVIGTAVHIEKIGE